MVSFSTNREEFPDNKEVEMRRGLLFVALMISIFSLTACAGIGGYTQPGGLFPVGLVYTDSVSGSQVLDNGATASKKEKTSGTYIIFVGTGDTSVETTKKNKKNKKQKKKTQTKKTNQSPIYG